MRWEGEKKNNRPLLRIRITNIRQLLYNSSFSDARAHFILSMKIMAVLVTI